MSTETTEHESDAEWFIAHAGTKQADEQIEAFCERVSIKCANGKTSEEARIEAFEGR